MSRESCSKKESQFFNLVDVLDYDGLDDAHKEHKQAQGRRLPRDASGASYDNPAHLLGAANYIKRAWDAV